MPTHDLEGRINKLEKDLPAIIQELRHALEYVEKDAASSLNKSRTVLEHLLIQLYTAEMGHEPRKRLVGDMLADNQFTRKIERRILSRMNAIRDMGNLGSHGERVESSDAARALDDLCEVLDWYTKRSVAGDTDVPRPPDSKPVAPSAPRIRPGSIHRGTSSPKPQPGKTPPVVPGKRRRWIVLAGVGLVVVALMIWQPWESPNFLDYFPMEVGATWFYSVEVGDVRPLVYRESFWPKSKLSKGGKTFGYALRTYPDALLPSMKKRQTYFVRLSVAGNLAPSNPREWASKSEIAIDQDDLGYYGNPRHLYWKVRTVDRIVVLEERVYSEDHGPRGIPVEGDGKGERLLFLGDKEHIRSSLIRGEQDPVEHLAYRGIDRRVPGYEGIPCVHLQRTLGASEGKEKDDLSKGWTEDAWFARDQGMVRLVQTIDGKPSMTWNLQKVSRGPGVRQPNRSWWSRWSLGLFGAVGLGMLVVARFQRASERHLGNS